MMKGMTEPDASQETSEELILAFLNECAERLTVTSEPPASGGAAALMRALDRSAPLTFEPGWLEVLETIHAVDPTPLGRRFVDVAPLLPWIPTPRADDAGTEFALAPLERVRDMGDLTVGMMYVGPGRQYPLHRHPPNELYLTIAGRADWRFGGHDDFRSIGPDTIIYNHPGDLHSVIAGDTPLVAFYVLWN